MACDFLFAPTRVEVVRPDSTPAVTNAVVPVGLAPTNATPPAANYPERVSGNVPEFNASHVSTIAVDSVRDESHCSAITADSVCDPQPHLDCLDSGPMGVVPHNNPKLAQGRCSVPPVVHPKIS
jgi:hypothetical protein